MAFTCKRGTILYGRRCIGCDCERASLPLPEQPPREHFTPRPIRLFRISRPDPTIVEHQADPHRAAPSTCLHCGATTLPCFKCEDMARYPLQGQFSTHFHTGHCPQHGLLRQLCPETEPAEDPILRGIEERAAHHRKEVTTAATISLAGGFIMGVAAGLAVAAFYFRQLIGG